MFHAEKVYRILRPYAFKYFVDFIKWIKTSKAHIIVRTEKDGRFYVEVVCEFFVNNLGRVVETEAGELKVYAKKDGLKDAVLTMSLSEIFGYEG